MRKEVSQLQSLVEQGHAELVASQPRIQAQLQLIGRLLDADDLTEEEKKAIMQAFIPSDFQVMMACTMLQQTMLAANMLSRKVSEEES